MTICDICHEEVKTAKLLLCLYEFCSEENDDPYDHRIEYDLCAKCSVKAERGLTSLIANMSTYTDLRKAVPSLTPNQASAVIAYVKATTGKDIK